MKRIFILLFMFVLVASPLICFAEINSAAKAGTMIKDAEQTMATDSRETEFYDVKPSDSFAAYVEEAVDLGILKGEGDGRFNPYGTCTRAQIVTVLHRLAGEPSASTDAGFSDVPQSAYYKAAVDWAYENGVVLGYTMDEFAPLEEISRQQLITMIFRYSKYMGYDTENRKDAANFSDANEIAYFAKTAVSWANAEGMVDSAASKLFRPSDAAKRYELAEIIVKYCSYFLSQGEN